MNQLRVAGYAKLAKYWEKDRNGAITFHDSYFREKFSDPSRWCFIRSFVDITGAKEIRRRPQMLHLLDYCSSSRVDLIFTQTKGYLAANTDEFCFLIRFLSEIAPNVTIQTEDRVYHLDTLENSDHQKEELLRMVDRYCSVNPEHYEKWKEQVRKGIEKQRESTGYDGKQQIR